MLENRHINKIIIGLMILAVIVITPFMLLHEGSSFDPSSTDEDYYNQLFDKEEVIEINIEMQDADWEWIIENATDEEYRGGNITINGETFYNVGIRPKGNSSLREVANDNTTDRYSFKIKFDKYVDGQTYYGLDELVINNMMSDATYMKEYLSYDLFEKMDIVTPLYSFANININDEPWGLYLAVESTDESYLKRNFGTEYGNLYKPESPGSSLEWIDEDHSSYQGIKDNALTKVTDEDFDNVIELINSLNNGSDVDKYLDVDEVLRYFAVNTLLVNLDSYAGSFNHNYLLYEENGFFSILPWDLNMSFAGFQMNDAQKAIDFSIDTPYSGNAEDYPLISKLLEIPEYKEIYERYLEEATMLYFDSGLFQVTIDKLDSLISEYVENDATAFYSYEEYAESLPVLKEFGELRAKSIIAQLSGETTAGTVDLDLNALGGMGGMGEKNVGMNRPANIDKPNPPDINQNMNPVEDDLPIDRQPKDFQGNKQANDFPRDKQLNNFPGDRQVEDFNQLNKQGIGINTLTITVGISVLIMIIFIFFISKFKRYKYIKDFRN